MDRKYVYFFYYFVFCILMNFQFLNFNRAFQVYIVWILISCFFLGKNFMEDIFKPNKNILYFFVWLLPMIVSLSYSLNLGQGFKKIQTLLPILLTPLIFFSLEEKIKKQLFRLSTIVFPISTIAFGLYVIIKLNVFFYKPYVIQYGKPDILNYIIFVYNHRFGYLMNTDEIKVFSVFFHKVYFSIALLISMLFIKLWSNLFLKISMFVLAVLLLLLFRSIPQIILGLVMILYFAYKRYIKYNRNVLLLLMMCFLLACSYMYYMLNLSDFIFGSQIERILVYKCALLSFIQRPIFGYGIGDVNQVLENCYLQINCAGCLGLNSHNQYVNVLLSSGIIGFIVFVGYLIHIFVGAIKNQNQSLFLFIIIFMFSFMFENILSRMWGVSLFILFYCILFYQPTKNQTFCNEK